MWAKLLMGSYEVLFLQMKPYLISHLKLMWYLMLIMALLVIGIGFFQNITNMLLDVLDSLNKFGCSIRFILNMRLFLLCNCNRKSYVNGSQWLEPKAHLKRVVASRSMEGSMVVMLKIRKTLTPYAWMF
jgi:hypothetical protein